MNFLKKILHSLGLLLVVAFGTSLSFLHFYNRTPWRISIGIILGIVLYIGLARKFIWCKK